MQESLEASLIRIHTPDGHVVGAGFLVGERYILTCAHVVAGALGLVDDTPDKPQALVSLDVPRVAPGQLLNARVVLWRPPLPDGGDDLAGLELIDDPPHGSQAAPLAQVEDLWDHSFRAFGFPRGQDTGVWATGRLLGRQLTNWVQIEDVKETGFAVEPGFSGTPVWDPQVEAVVGMVVAAERRMNLKTAFAIPVDVLVRSWPQLESLINPFVFLSYARADSDLVTRLKSDLLGQGIHVWIDREGFQPGTLDWEEALRTAIRAARAVLLIASPNTRSSRYIRDELFIAEMYQRPVYPLWIAGTQWMEAVPLGWGGAQYLDARENRYETAILELVALLNKAASTPTNAPKPDFEPRNSSPIPPTVSPRRLVVFLCHSSSDKSIVRTLYQRLKDYNVDPWLDEENLLPGQNWEHKIRKGVKDSDIVIVCLSRGSISKTGFVQKEIKFALDVADEQPEDTIYLIPLRLEECEIPERLRHLHWVNYTDEKWFLKLMQALKRRSESFSEKLAPVILPNS